MLKHKEILFSSKVLNTHLSNCDLINKFNINSVFSIPKLNSIKIKLTLIESLKTFNKKESSISKEDIQIHSFILLYFLSNFMPFIKIKKQKNIDNFGSECLLNLFFNNKEQKDLLIKNIFIESWSYLKRTESAKNLLKKKIELSSVSLDVPMSTFIEVNEFLDKSNQNSKEALVSLNFYFLNLKNKNLNKNNVIKNLPLFWVSG